MVTAIDVIQVEGFTEIRPSFTCDLVANQTCDASNFDVVINGQTKTPIFIGTEAGGEFVAVIDQNFATVTGSFEILASDGGLQMLDGELVNPQGPYEF